MGTDKALLTLEGRPLIARAITSLQPFCTEVAIAGGAPELAQYGTLLEDASPGEGPLSGIVTALRHTSAEYICILAVDVPFVPRTVWLQLLKVARHSESAAVIPRFADQPHPLCAIYSRRCLPQFTAELAAHRLKVMSAAHAAGPVTFIDFDRNYFQNWNTPADVRQIPNNF